jgi:hypothetical protein
MKWWDRLKQLQKHRWLPFFLPVVGTLLYIFIAVLCVPSEFGEKSDSVSLDSDKPSADLGRAKAASRAARKRTTTVPGAAVPSAVTPATPQ